VRPLTIVAVAVTSLLACVAVAAATFAMQQRRGVVPTTFFGQGWLAGTTGQYSATRCDVLGYSMVVLSPVRPPVLPEGGGGVIDRFEVIVVPRWARVPGPGEHQVSTYAAGIPFRFLSGSFWMGGVQQAGYRDFVWLGRGVGIPARVHVGPLLGNWAAFALTGLALLATGKAVRGRLRAGRGRCAACGYRLEAWQAACPECGQERGAWSGAPAMRADITSPPGC